VEKVNQLSGNSGWLIGIFSLRGRGHMLSDRQIIEKSVVRIIIVGNKKRYLYKQNKMVSYEGTGKY
jgi:hypothetical protein